METIKNVGLINCGNSTLSALRNDFGQDTGFRLTKVMATNSTSDKDLKEIFPHAENVSDTGAIIYDHSIELVIVAKPSDGDLSVVAEALGAGKQVRVL
jgi:predicted dehydrogenase